MVRKFAKNDEGVSAVIGVILMVAITVILAAVIAAFVFSMSNNVSKPYTVGITIKKTASGDVLITNSGGPDVGQLKAVNVTYQPKDSDVALQASTGRTYKEEVDDVSGKPDNESTYFILTQVGGSYTIKADGISETDAGDDPTTPTHVIVIGYFKDGKTQVIGEADV